MFDPLTSSSLTLDQIVQMCDELIAAHGDLLPKLDARRSLVPGCGKPFGPVNPRELRDSWDAAQKKSTQHYLTDWHIIGAFSAQTNGRNGLNLETPVETQLALLGDGSVDLGSTVMLNGIPLKWRCARTNRRGCVDLGKLLGKIEWSVAYGYTELHSEKARDVVLRCGSDDGIQIWINGKIVHRNEIGRAYCPDSDQAAIHLNAGRNHILVKIDNYHGGWGFGVAIPGE
jgi:hypothetical protein